MSTTTTDPHGTPGPLDPSTELPIDAAAELCGVVRKTLIRDEQQGKLQLTRRAGRVYATVQALIDAGRHTPGEPSPADVRELSDLRTRFVAMREASVQLEADLRRERELRQQAESYAQQLSRICEQLSRKAVA